LACCVAGNTSWVYDPDLDDVVEVSKILVFDGIDKATCILYVPTADALEAYKEADGWKEFGDNIRLIVTKQAQSIENFTDITKTYGNADFALAATATSSLPVTYSIADASVATITNGTVHILKVGSTTITATQAGNDSYDAAAPVTVTLTVSKADQGINFTNITKPTVMPVLNLEPFLELAAVWDPSSLP